MQLVRHLLHTYGDTLTFSSIGVISPYNGQVRAIRALLKDNAEIGGRIEVNSVDGFQGREKDVIILSAVRSDRARQSGRGIGFLRDARRMNVSITRARSSVFVLGHADTLRQDPLWEAALNDATERGVLLQVHTPIGIWFEHAVKEPARMASSMDVDSEELGEAHTDGARPRASSTTLSMAPRTAGGRGGRSDRAKRAKAGGAR